MSAQWPIQPKIPESHVSVLVSVGQFIHIEVDTSLSAGCSSLPAPFVEL